MNRITFTSSFIHHPLSSISHFCKIIEAIFWLRFRSKELIFAINSLGWIAEDKFVIFAHYDRFFGTDFLAIAAENAAKHVDLENYRIAFLQEFRLAGPHFDGKRRADPRA